jgi:hypothetical protein
VQQRFHWAGRAAECAENIYFKYAVDPPKILADRKDGKIKNNPPLTQKITHA